MSLNKRARARRAASQVIYQWQMTAAAPAEVVAQFEEDDRLAKLDRELFLNLTDAVTRESEALDELLGECMDRDINRVDPVERAVLRLGAYELRSRLEVPWRVVINEAVELARAFGAEQGHRYVNAVLDKLARRLRAGEIGRV